MSDIKQNEISMDHVEFLQNYWPVIENNIQELTGYIQHEIFTRIFKNVESMEPRQISYHMEHVEFLSKHIQDLCCLVEKIKQLK